MKIFEIPYNFDKKLIDNYDLLESIRSIFKNNIEQEA